MEIEKLWKKIEELEKRGDNDGMSEAETLGGDGDV